MELWLKFSNLITVGNMGSVTVLICAGIFFYYKIRRYLAQQHADFLAYVGTLTENQTKRLEDCIHRQPNHPENPATPPAPPPPPAPPAPPAPAIIVNDLPGD